MAPTNKWSENDTVKFVGLYKECETLWNVREENYKNRDKRNSSFEYIQREMNKKDLTIEMVKKKIKSIRDTYSLEKSKIKKFNKSGTSPDLLYKPRLVWFNEAATFLDYCTGRESCNSMDSTDVEVHRDESSENVTEINGPIQGTSTQTQIEQPANVARNQQSRKRKKDTIVPDHIAVAIEKLDDLKKSSGEKDEFHFFAMNLAHQLRKLPLERALRCQLNLQDILMRERIDYEREKYEASHSSNMPLPVPAVPSISPEREEYYIDQTSGQSQVPQFSAGSNDSNDILSEAIGGILKDRYYC